MKRALLIESYPTKYYWIVADQVKVPSGTELISLAGCAHSETGVGVSHRDDKQ
jgi:hypothetical protein